MTKKRKKKRGGNYAKRRVETTKLGQDVVTAPAKEVERKKRTFRS